MAALPVRIGFLGCGQFAQYYHVPALRQSAATRIAAICDPQPGAALRRIAAELDIPFVSDIEELLAAALCDAVIISTPHALHAAHAHAVLEAGRHVLVDKPFVMHVVEADALAALAAARGRVAGVAFNRRLDRGCIRAREIIRNGALGAIRYVETVQLGYPTEGWLIDPALGGGGPFTGRAAHMADLVPWLIGAPPRAVRARLRPGPPGRTDSGGFIEVMFERTECHMTCLEEGLDMWDEVRIFGEDGLVELRRPLGLAIGWGLSWRGKSGDAIEEIAADSMPGGCTGDFVAAIATGGATVCNFVEATISVAIIEAAFASAAQGERWLSLG